MLSDRMNGMVPNGVVSAPVSVPAKEVLTRPYTAIKDIAAWPPSTGVANT